MDLAALDALAVVSSGDAEGASVAVEVWAVLVAALGAEAGAAFVGAGEIAGPAGEQAVDVGPAGLADPALGAGDADVRFLPGLSVAGLAGVSEAAGVAAALLVGRAIGTVILS